MNKFILKVMRQLDNPEALGLEEMSDNSNDAWDALWTKYNGTAADITIAESMADYAAEASYDAYCITAGATVFGTTILDIYKIKYGIGNTIEEYFKVSGEDIEVYLKEVERLR